MPNHMTMDADEIAARFYLINLAVSQVKNGTGTTNALIAQVTSPSPTDINNAIRAVKNTATADPLGTPCSPCTIISGSTTTRYYGLTTSECVAMGGTCPTKGPPP
jgi:hypothetical protein